MLNLMPLERAAAPNYLRAGLGLSANTASQNDFTLLFSSQHIWLSHPRWGVAELLGDWPQCRHRQRRVLSAAGLGDPVVCLGQRRCTHESVLPVFGIHKDKLSRYTVRQQSAYAEVGLSLGNYGELRGGGVPGQCTCRTRCG